MKKSFFYMLACLSTFFVMATFVSCDPNNGEDVYIVPEDDGPDSIDVESN